MATWDQIVIGCGTSAMTFVHAALHGTQKSKFVKQETLVIGKPSGQLWDKVARRNSSHEMGQPKHLLRPSGLPADPALQGGHKQFIKTGDYNAMLNQLVDKTQADCAKGGLAAIWLLEANATGIVDIGAGFYRVSTDVPGQFETAKQVIIAGGTGSSQDLRTIGVPVEGNIDDAAASGEYIDAVDYMTKKHEPGLNVLVYGGSASSSSSWAVAHAFAMSAGQLTWACRQGVAQIDTDGNPVGRNSATIERAKKAGMIHQFEIGKIEVVGNEQFKGRIHVHFNVPHPVLGDKMAFDQLVYSVGANPVEPLGPGGILKGDLPGRMIPVWDNNYRFSQTAEGAAITALKDDLGDLWVVGAAVYRGLGVKTIIDELNKNKVNFYAKVGDILCSAGRPPEGIAIIDATINAVTGYRQTDEATFNWNKANRRDIFQFLAKIYNVEIRLSVREQIVDEIIAFRTKTSFGITQLQLENLMSNAVKKHRLQIDLNKFPGVWDGT